MNTRKIAYAVCLGSYLALAMLLVYWHSWLTDASLISGSLVLWVLPLLFALGGVVQDKIYTHAWTSMLSWLYFTHGVVELNGAHATLAATEIAFSLIWFTSAIVVVKNHPDRKSAKKSPFIKP